ncbi:MAG: flagellar hook-length control protein FliK [Holophagales bacterium]|jgi:flagellar hook-length control protein FliK|nr:flagellar hook-length control protein FliK [Holophagales bacterium]
MADIQLLPITPTAPAGDFAPSKVTDSAGGESFGQALDQAKTTVSEKKHSPEKHEKESVKKSDRSSKKHSAALKKGQKPVASNAPILPASAEPPVSKAESAGVNTEVAGQMKKSDEEIFPIPQAPDNQAATSASELVVWQTVIPDFADPLNGDQRAADFDSDDLMADGRQISNSDSVESPINELKIMTEREFIADRADALAAALATKAIPQEVSDKARADFMAWLDARNEMVSSASVLNGRQQAAAPEKTADTPNSEQHNIENVGGDRGNTHFADEALQTPGPRIAKDITPAATAIPNDAQSAEAADKSRTEGKTRLTDAPPDEKPNLTAASNQRPSRQSADNMSLGEAKEALPPSITNTEVSGEVESGAEFRSGAQKAASIIEPRVTPLVIESALPRPSSDETQAAAREIAADKIAADESAIKAEPAPKTVIPDVWVELSSADSAALKGEPATKHDKIPVGEAVAKTDGAPQKAAANDQPTASAAQTEPAPVKAPTTPTTPIEPIEPHLPPAPPEYDGLVTDGLPKAPTATQATQSTPSVIVSAPPKASGDEIRAETVQAGSGEPASKAAETPAIETETKSAALKSERAAANNRQEPTSPVVKETQANSQVGQITQAGSERQSGGQSDTSQNQPQNTAEAYEIKEALNVKNDEPLEFKAKFNSILNSSVQGQQATEAKTANTIPAAHAENLFTAANTDLSSAAPSQSGQPIQPNIVSPKQFLPSHAPMSQLEGSVRWLLRTDTKGAEIQLHPENLGRVTVRLRIEGSEVHARVWATEASTMPLLENHKAFLESSLKEQGLTLSSFDLQHGKNGQQTHGDAQNHHQRFAPPMMESWNGTEFRQELPAQLAAQHADDGGVELYA